MRTVKIEKSTSDALTKGCALPQAQCGQIHFQLRGRMQEKSFMLGVQDVGKMMLIFLMRNNGYCQILSNKHSPVTSA